jgi:hypothetical protein
MTSVSASPSAVNHQSNESKSETLDRTFWLSSITPKEEYDFEDVVENCDWQSIASQIAMNYFVGCDYHETNIGTTSIKGIKEFFDKYCESYQYSIREDGTQKWFFNGSDNNGENEMDED